MHDKVADRGENAAAFLDCADNGGEVVICQHNVCHTLGNIRAGDAHCNADVSLLDGGGVIYTISSHGNDLAATVKRLNHPHFALGRTAGDDERQLSHLVQLLIRHGIHFGASRDDVTLSRARGDDADLPGDGLGCSGVIT
eukprot:scaffold54742_cov47-Prasinocladus_malaysianus.AAC.2